MPSETGRNRPTRICSGSRLWHLTGELSPENDRWWATPIAQCRTLMISELNSPSKQSRNRWHCRRELKFFYIRCGVIPAGQWAGWICYGVMTALEIFLTSQLYSLSRRERHLRSMDELQEHVIGYSWNELRPSGCVWTLWWWWNLEAHTDHN